MGNSSTSGESTKGNGDRASYIFLGLLIGYFILAFIVKITWDYTVPELFGGKPISYLQSMALLILLNILFGSFSSHCIQIVS